MFLSGDTRCSFTFDPENFPDPKAYLSEIKQKYGVKICVWSACFPSDRTMTFSLNFLPPSASGASLQ